MYKNPRKKSERSHPYDIASSTAKKSGRFISPIIDYNLSLSATKKNEKSHPNISNLNETIVESSIQNKTVPLIDSMYLSKEKNNHILNQSDDQTIVKVKEQSGVETNQKSDFDEDISKKLEQNKKVITNSTNINAEGDFDSDLDALFCDSSLEDKFNKFNNDIEIKDSDKNVCEQEGEDLFDSDAIINDGDSLQLDSQLDDDFDNIDEFQISNSNDLNNKSYKDDIDDVNKYEEINDEIREELDTTLIFRSNDPILSQYIIKPVQLVPEDEQGFKTASGMPIKINMTEEEQRMRAKQLGF